MGGKVDLDFNPTRPSEETVFAHITCINRGLAEQMEPGSPLQIEEAAPAAKIICLQRPTPLIGSPNRSQQSMATYFLPEPECAFLRKE